MATTWTYQLPLRLEVVPSSGILPSIEREAKAHQHIPSSLFGRSFEEAIADLASLVKSLEPRKVNCPATPLLVFDLGYSPPSTPGFWTPPSNSHALSRDASPSPSPLAGQRFNVTRNLAKMRTYERSQVLQWPFEALRSPRPTHRASPMSLESAAHDDADAASLLLAEDQAFMNEAGPARFIHGRPSTAIRDHSEQGSDAIPDSLSHCENLGALHWSYGGVRPGDCAPSLSQGPSLSPSVELGSPMGLATSTPDANNTIPLPPSPSIPSSPAEGGQKQKQKGQRRQKQIGPFVCPHCPGKTFTRNFDMKRHMKSVHEKHDTNRAQARTCPCCFEVLSREDAFIRHCRRVPRSCVRHSQLLKKPAPALQPESFYRSVRQRAEKTFSAQRKGGRKA